MEKKKIIDIFHVVVKGIKKLRRTPASFAFCAKPNFVLRTI